MSLKRRIDLSNQEEQTLENLDDTSIMNLKTRS